MNTKNILYMISIGLFVVAFSGVVYAGAPASELLAKIPAELLQLESAKKASLMQCNRFKESAPDNYAHCRSEYSGRFEAEMDMLKRDPEGYFARKQKVSSNTGYK